MAFYDVETARADWINAPANDDLVEHILNVARIQVLTYAPALPEGAEIPEHYVYGQLVQAQNIWTATSVDASGSFGEGEYIRTPHPLDWHVKGILRPRRAVGYVG